MKCPVCGKEFNGKVGASSHLFKTKDKEHKKFVEYQKKLVRKAFYTNVSCEILATKCWVSTAFICNIWKQIPGYKKRKSRMNSISLKCQHKGGKKKISKNFHGGNRKYKTNQGHTITQEIYDKIISFFDSDLNFKQISNLVGCDPKTVKSTFVREFGTEKYNNRTKIIRQKGYKKSGISNSLKVKEPNKYKSIIKEFNGDKGIRTIAKKLKTSGNIIKNIWIEKFGKRAYEKRVAKMLWLQRIRAAKSLKKAKFLGSKNEIYCFNLLNDKYPGIVKHHDYNIVPRLEIDISIPSKKVAICWDGIGHRKPAFGNIPFEKVRKNDAIRDEILKNKGWFHISVIDDGSYDPVFVENKVNKIINLVETSYYIGKVEI